MDQQAQLEPFQRLVERHSPSLLRYLEALVGGAAEDCLQEALLAALDSYPGLREPRAARAWLFAICRRKAIDHLRRAERDVPDPDPELLADERLAEPGVGESGLGELVARLPLGRRDAILLRFGADLSHREVGTALGISEAAARRRVADGLADLRAHLDAAGLDARGLVA